MAGIKASTLNVMLNRLAKNGIVEMKNDKNNSKIKCVYLTNKGEQIQQIAYNKMCELKNKQFEGFSEEEKQQLKKYMQKINQNLNNILKEEDN